jgi:hypothetical protein
MKAKKYPIFINISIKVRMIFILPEPKRTKNPEVTSISECSFLKYFTIHT